MLLHCLMQISKRESLYECRSAGGSHQQNDEIIFQFASHFLLRFHLAVKVRLRKLTDLILRAFNHLTASSIHTASKSSGGTCSGVETTVGLDLLYMHPTEAASAFHVPSQSLNCW